MDNKTEIGNKCFGIYLGTVVQHLTHGRLKVYIQSIYPKEWETNPSLLPICTQVSPQFGGSHAGNGTFSYPNIGSTVVCMFANGDQNFPITMGSLLGGENAFGQYEIIKTNDELSSSKHLITAGQSHYEMYESGKISSIVVSPIRTQATVDYGSQVDSPLSIDAVTSREICEQVDNHEIGSINCQHVLDNEYDNGTISSSTYCFRPLAESSNEFLSAEQQKKTGKTVGQVETSSYSIVNNAGQRMFGQISSIDCNVTTSIIDLQQPSNTNAAYQYTNNVSTAFNHNLSGSNWFQTISSNVDSINTAYTDGASGKSIISTSNSETSGSSAYGFNIDSSFGISGEVNQKLVSQYSDQFKDEQKSKTLKFTNRSSMVCDGKNKLEFYALSSSKLNEMTQNSTHSNTHQASVTIDESTSNGIKLDSVWKDTDIRTLGSVTIQSKYDNFVKDDHQSGEDPFIYRSVQKKGTSSINSFSRNYNVICEELMSPTDGQISVSILDKLTKHGCCLTMDSKGNLTISATTSISINAPDVMINGKNLTTKFANTNMLAQQMLISGTRGDCKIKNVSLLNHKHVETQAGDVVSPQPTKIATQSN